MMAGATFIKTSTGKESVNATLSPVGLTMVRAIRDFHVRTGYAVGFKPPGVSAAAKASLDWLIMMKEVLGCPGRGRSASASAPAVCSPISRRQLEHHVTAATGRAPRHPMVERDDYSRPT